MAHKKTAHAATSRFDLIADAKPMGQLHAYSLSVFAAEHPAA
jgi:hypothetical protein